METKASGHSEVELIVFNDIPTCKPCSTTSESVKDIPTTKPQPTTLQSVKGVQITEQDINSEDATGTTRKFDQASISVGVGIGISGAVVVFALVVMAYVCSKRCIRNPVINWGRRLSAFLSQMRRLFRGGA